MDIPAVSPKSQKSLLLVIISIIGILLLSLIIYLFFEQNQLRVRLNELDEMLEQMTTENRLLKAQAADLNAKFADFDASVAAYLVAEGRPCASDTLSCIRALTKELSQKEGADCSPLTDTVCPAWSAAGADYDCCVEKLGYQWLAGRGCVLK